MIEPLSADILDRMRADHFTAAAMQFNRCCYCGDSWPCDVRLLLAELDRREANPPRWQGRNHRSPVPHLAGMLPTWPDVVEKVTGVRIHNGVSCCEWANDGVCPWTRQFVAGPALVAGISMGLLGPHSESELAR